MDARATRMGSETLGYTAPRNVAPAQSEIKQLWGQVPPGIRSIIKVVVVAAVAYAALTLLAPGIAYTIGSAVAGIGSTVISGVQAALAFFGISTAAAGIGTAAAAETVSLGAGTAAAAAGIGSAAILPAAKTATITASTVSVAPVTPSITPDISSVSAPAHTLTPDSSTVVAQKGALASKAAVSNVATTNFIDLPDMPTDQFADHTHTSHLHTDNAKMASKLGQEAVEIQDHAKRHAASTRDHISRIEDKVSQWSDRVGGSKAAIASHADLQQKRDAVFASELHDERARPDQGLGHSV